MYVLNKPTEVAHGLIVCVLRSFHVFAKNESAGVRVKVTNPLKSAPEGMGMDS